MSAPGRSRSQHAERRMRMRSALTHRCGCRGDTRSGYSSTPGWMRARTGVYPGAPRGRFDTGRDGPDLKCRNVGSRRDPCSNDLHHLLTASAVIPRHEGRGPRAGTGSGAVADRSRRMAPRSRRWFDPEMDGCGSKDAAIHWSDLRTVEDPREGRCAMTMAGPRPGRRLHHPVRGNAWNGFSGWRCRRSTSPRETQPRQS
jgi:hypothetical protein